jgi:hypothetical protein
MLQQAVAEADLTQVTFIFLAFRSEVNASLSFWLATSEAAMSI